MSDIMDTLKQFDGQYEASEASSSGSTDVPEGKYTMKVVDTDVFSSKSENRPYFKIALQVTDGEFKGSTINKIYSLDDPARFKFLKGDLIVCGLMLTRISDLPANHEKIRGRVLNVQAKKNGQYTNYFINGAAHPNADLAKKSENVPF